MTPGEIETLRAALNDPAQADKHDRIRAVLAEHAPAKPLELRRGTLPSLQMIRPLPPERAAPAAPTAPAPPEPEPEGDGFGARMQRGLKRIAGPVNTAAMLVNEGMNTATLGLTRGISDELSDATGVRIGPGPEQFNQLHEQHPDMTALSQLGGALSPGGLPSKIGMEATRLTDPLLRAMLKRTASAPGQIAARTAAGAVAGAGAAGVSSAVRGTIETGDSMQGLDQGVKAIPGGLAFGGGLSALAGTAAAGARAIGKRSPDIQALERANLEPSPIPGRPVVRRDLPLRSQLPGLSEPPLVGRATPETRASAGRVAAQEIVPNITARKKANNKRFGELQEGAYMAQGDLPAEYEPIIADIKARLGSQKLPDATRSALQAVLSRFDPYIPKPPPEPVVNPEIENLQTMLAGSKPGVARQGLEQAIAEARARAPQPEPVPEPRPFTARDLDEIRDYADSKVRAKEISGKDVPFLQLRERMRGDLEKVAPQITGLNKQQHELLQGFEKRKALIGMKRDQRGEGEDIYDTVGRHITQRGEETKASGARRGTEGHAIERAGRMGQPPVLPGTKGLPPEIGYQELMDQPRLQLAQENLQLSPSQVFSGGGRAALSNVARMAANVPLRLGYPTLRRTGNIELGGKAVAADDLSGAIERRRAKKKSKRSKGAEMSREGDI